MQRISFAWGDFIGGEAQDFTARGYFDPSPVANAGPNQALAGGTRGRVPDQVAFRLGFPRWRAGFGGRDRAVLDALAAGGRTGAVAGRFGLSPARVSQLRRLFRESWRDFHRGAAAG